MLKKLKIMSIFAIILLVMGSASIYATDINMNLTSNGDIQTSFNEEISTNNQYVSNTSNNYKSSNTSDVSQSSTVVTSTSSVQNESIGMSNILNILLIVVGLVLILLGVAILIRMFTK